ncbi:MAG: tRNA (guanosine(37)-N1)-methyltransferase TrmD, partial [Faecalicoccus sp.]|nr:tRNA (guanosine(37)-N1)-methyltransferase TrmD [Faecalicoccus sp.]
DDSFSNGLLEYPQYTRPEIYDGKRVPEVLLSGHHQNIEIWRHEQSLLKTLKNRPDLLESADLSDKDKEFIQSYIDNNSNL